MRERVRNGAAVIVAAVCLAIAIPTLSQPPRTFTGITLRFDGSTLVVATVDRASPLASAIEPGMVVTEVYFTPVADIDPTVMSRYLAGEFSELGVTDLSGEHAGRFEFPPRSESGSELVLLACLAIFLGVAISVGLGLAGEELRPIALPLAATIAAPGLLLPVWPATAGPAAVALAALSVAPLLALSDAFIERIRATGRRRSARVASIGAAAAYLGVVAVLAGSGLAAGRPNFAPELLLILMTTIVLLPAAIVVRDRASATRDATRAGSPPRSAMPFLLVALAPIGTAIPMSLYPQLGIGLEIPLASLLIIAILLQSGTRIETLKVQRDNVVAASEAERARLAADLHDDALQEMTVLLRRLDESGDKGAADLARTIADRLREVCGDLRLPILDELGAGPALEWLVDRVGQTSGHNIILERADEARPPATVELAAFRVAQEALANAVRHGAPPIVVRYAAASDRMSLSISDEGAGIVTASAAAAGRSGHYGLLNMRQRAEQIGGTFDIRTPPRGGTSIGLRWSSS